MAFTESERDEGQPNLAALAQRKAEGRRYSRIAPFGNKWQRRGKTTLMVAAPREQQIMRRVAEMKTVGYSIDQIRQYLAYEWQVKNRNGRDFGSKEIAAWRFAELNCVPEPAITGGVIAGSEANPLPVDVS